LQAFAAPQLVSLGAMRKRLTPLTVTGLAVVALAAGGCGAGVAAGGENAAEHPGNGIFVARTVGGGDVSVTTETVPGQTPVPTFKPPSSTSPASLPPGLTETVAVVEAAVTGGCWEDARAGNVYGAYDQLFWFQGQCGDAVAGVTVELYPSSAAAGAAAHHESTTALLGRYQDGAVIVDVYSSAPALGVLQLAKVHGLAEVSGYGE